MLDNLERLAIIEKEESNLEEFRKIRKRSPNYLGKIKNHPLYNMWRSFKFTKKGKKIGNSEDWNDYICFYRDVIDHYKPYTRLNRLNYSKPFSKDNFCFISDGQVGKIKRKPKFLTIKGVTKSLKEWAVELDITASALNQRYNKGKKHKYTDEEILYNAGRTCEKVIRDYAEMSNQKIRNKASKMISQYRVTDRRLGYDTNDLTIEYMLENVFGNTCVYCGDDKRIGLDRVCNNKSHDIENVVPCCYECNVARNNNFTHDEMKIIGKTIAKIKQVRKNNV